MSSRRLLGRSIGGGGCLIGLAAVAALVIAHGASGTARPQASDGFAVFGQGAASAPEQQLVSLADDVGANATDRMRFRVLAAGLGQFHSRLVAFPARDGQLVCYSLLGARAEEPGMSYSIRQRTRVFPHSCKESASA
jgi:hypothetical protein